MEFYEIISELNNNTENRMFTVCDGEFAGEKMILSGGGIVWKSNEDGFLAVHSDEAVSAEIGKLSDICGTKVFSEILGNEKEIVICGAGHVSMPVISIAKMMGFRVTAIDDREVFVQNALSRGADEGLCVGFEEGLSRIPGSPDTYFIIVTRGHRYDAECLLSIVKKPYGYIGMIGSRRKISMVRNMLSEKGIPQDVIDSVHMPIGLDIGAETPEEIAVAILGEIIEVKNAKKRNSGFSGAIMDALLAGSRDKAVLATIISKKGSSPRGAGTRMLAGKEGLIAGTIGGGQAEARALQRAAEMLDLYDSASDKKEALKPEVMKVDMTGKEIEDEGMICGGAIDVLLEIV